MKVIPAVDIMGGAVVRLVKGDPANKTIYSSDPVGAAKRWEAAGADMLHVVDLDAALGTGSNNAELISKIASSVKVPVEVGGGIRTPEAAKAALDIAARAVIGTMAYSDPEAVRKLAKKHPGRIVISIDQSGGGKVMVKGWQESSGVKVEDAIAQFRAMGIDDFLLTSIDRDGTLGGPDIPALAQAAMSGARIIASGGISSVEDAIRVRSVGCAAVILGKAMYDGKVSVERVKAIA